MAFWMGASVRVSTLLVASSRMRMAGSARTARTLLGVQKECGGAEGAGEGDGGRAGVVGRGGGVVFRRFKSLLEKSPLTPL